MTIFTTFDALWTNAFVIGLVATGITLVWLGLYGRGQGEQALLRAETTMLGRIEGFRLMVFGLVVIGVALAILWHAQWLLLLALGIGFVEILESSVLIAFWKTRR